MKSRNSKAKTVLLKNTLAKTVQETDPGAKFDVNLLGANDSGRLSLVEFMLPVDAVRPKAAIHAKYHSVLAMEAARKMRRSRQKLKTGQQVCHHLKMMLASDPLPREAVPREQTAGAETQFWLGF